ncbi:2'-5' RNA ligase family protein [Nocardia brasiliensis]|uniref:2'-5' RNA ligase family protein n=1 Tax=Nocardia brasiliensis TaxID=37326 RepID=UPI0024539F2E|nr:2'-5' RNA ligase family protein [Nocardia brasiliensis]
MTRMDNAPLRRLDRRTGPLGYYWFLTFEHAPELHALTKTCQQSIDSDYFDLTSPERLHLTLDRIAYDGSISREHLEQITAEARSACQNQPPLVLTMGELTNLRGAVGFIASPTEAVHALRDKLRAATRSVHPDAPTKDSASKPHVTVAYPGFEDLSDRAAATAQTATATIDKVEVEIIEAVMVALERRPHAYEWDVISRIPLGG